MAGHAHHGPGESKAAYAAVMSVVGLFGFVVTWLATESVWWALLVLLLVGPVATVLLRLAGHGTRRR